MIKKITLDNFKAFEHAEIDIKPITILVGPNNGGKTSLLQPINLIKQTLRGSEVLTFPSALGDFDTVIHQKAKEKEIGLRYDFDEGTYFFIKVKKDEDGKLSLKDFSCNNGLYEYKIKDIKKKEIKDDAKKESEYYTSSPHLDRLYASEVFFPLYFEFQAYHLSYIAPFI